MKEKRIQGTIGGLLFVVLSIVVYMMEIHSDVVSFVLGFLACVAVILLVADFEDKFGKCMSFLAKYTMPIFLMHTLFVAPMRYILMKVGIESAVVHVVLGLGSSFVGPIVAAWIMKKTKWPEFFCIRISCFEHKEGRKKYEKSRNNIMVFINAIMCGK